MGSTILVRSLSLARTVSIPSQKVYHKHVSTPFSIAPKGVMQHQANHSWNDNAVLAEASCRALITQYSSTNKSVLGSAHVREALSAEGENFLTFVADAIAEK